MQARIDYKIEEKYLRYDLGPIFHEILAKLENIVTDCNEHETYLPVSLGIIFPVIILSTSSMIGMIDSKL
jgi:hypothetical protein